jgi:hypothetical protein
MEIKVKYWGMDDWTREVYEDIENGDIYKRYEGETMFYKAGSYYGEPIYLVGEEITFIIVK